MKRGPLDDAAVLAFLMKNVDKEDMLRKAIEAEETEAALSFIEQGANVNANLPHSNGVTLLMKAIEKQNPALEKALIDAGANVKAADKDGNTVLHYAAKYVSDNIPELLDKGADVQAVNKGNRTPLMLVGEYSLNPAQDAIKILIQRGAEIEKTDLFGQTALFHVINHGNMTAVEALLAHGANTNAVNTNLGNTPLFTAVTRKNVKLIQALLAHGANVNAVNAAGNTPLILAVLDDHIPTVKCLLHHGADVLAKTIKNETVLELGTGRGFDMIQVLALEGAEGKNRYTDPKKFFSPQMRAKLRATREQHFKDDAVYYVVLGLLQHPDEKKKAVAHKMLNSFETYKVDLADSAENIEKQQKENNNYINAMRLLSAVPVELKSKILLFAHQGLISPDANGIKKAQETAEVTLRRYGM